MSNTHNTIKSNSLTLLKIEVYVMITKWIFDVGCVAQHVHNIREQLQNMKEIVMRKLIIICMAFCITSSFFCSGLSAAPGRSEVVAAMKTSTDFMKRYCQMLWIGS